MSELERLKNILENKLASTSDFQRFELMKRIKQLESVEAFNRVCKTSHGENLIKDINKEGLHE